MSKVRSLVGCVALAAIGINVIAFHASAAKLTGDPLGVSEMAAFYGEGFKGTYCKTLTKQLCTGGTTAGCGAPALGSCASAGSVCSTCKGAANENCDWGTGGTCTQLPHAPCCIPNTCEYVGATVSTPNGSCTCSAAGAVAGTRSDC